MVSLEYKLVKQKKLGKELLLKVLVNESAERIHVEFSSKDGKMILQKSFQNNFNGKNEAKKFEKAFKNIKELKKHFGFSS